MAARVQATEVKEIVPSSIPDDVIVSSMIANATLVVDEALLSAGLSADRLKMIELYLAAHFVALTEEGGGVVESEFGDSRDQYADIYGDGLSSTRFGQMALALDSSKLLANTTSAKLSAQFRVV